MRRHAAAHERHIARRTPRRPASALAERWTTVDGIPVFFRESPAPPPDAPVMMHLHGFGLSGRYLLPTAEQLAAAEEVYRRKRDELAGRVELLWVLPDYFERYPKPCMGGWATTSLTVAPDGHAYPCPIAEVITTLRFPSVREHDLGWIWRESPAFNAYRGQAWLPQPCRSCERRSVDFGGCRCQAFLLTGDAARADPVCVHSPDHHLVADPVAEAAAGDRTPASAGRALAYRRMTVREPV